MVVMVLPHTCPRTHKAAAGGRIPLHSTPVNAIRMMVVARRAHGDAHEDQLRALPGGREVANPVFAGEGDNLAGGPGEKLMCLANLDITLPWHRAGEATDQPGRAHFPRQRQLYGMHRLL